MTPPLDGKAIVIIGGTTGLGLSAARAFVEAGARVVAVGRNVESCTTAQAQLGSAARTLSADACDPQTAPRAIDEALQSFSRFDGLYHVAGASGRDFGDGPLHEITDEGWRKTFDLNLTSLMYSNRAAVRQFLAQRTGGSILNMASVVAWSPSPRYFAAHAYPATKAAIVGFTISTAAYYAPHDIRINALAPGLTGTPMARRAVQNPAIMNFIHTKQPLDGGRIGAPADLDAAAVYFLGDGSKFCTGQVLAIDGGWCLSEGQHD
jgi:NAD(P)-dependent dehydrogenase (short-subunit alcohol dehydrogenase family)